MNESKYREIMDNKQFKVENTLIKILETIKPEDRPLYSFGWNADIIEIYLEGGGFGVMKAIESRFSNSSNFRCMGITNNNTKKRIDVMVK